MHRSARTGDGPRHSPPSRAPGEPDRWAVEAVDTRRANDGAGVVRLRRAGPRRAARRMAGWRYQNPSAARARDERRHRPTAARAAAGSMDGRRRDESLTAPMLMVCLGPSPTTSGSVPHDGVVTRWWMRAHGGSDAHRGISANAGSGADRDVGAGRGRGVAGSIAQMTCDRAQWSYAIGASHSGLGDSRIPVSRASTTAQLAVAPERTQRRQSSTFTAVACAR